METVEETSFDKVRRKMVTARIEFLGHLAKFSKDELTKKPAQGEWSPLQVAYHLYLADGLALEQVRRVQEEDNPYVESTEQALHHVAPLREEELSLENVLAGMAARREEIFSYLATVPNDAWTRPLRHGEWGDLKFYQLVNVLYRHDQGHSAQLVETKAKFDEQSKKEEA